MLTREQILNAFEHLASYLDRRNIVGEINLLGGTAMVLAFNARLATKDVDAIFAPSAEIREGAAAVAADLHLPADWLNDAAKGFSSENGTFEELGSASFPGLRVLAPTAEYLLAMKVMASRVGLDGGRGDVSDIEFLVKRLQLTTPASVMAIVEEYFDPSRIAPRCYYLVEEIFERLANAD